MKKNKTDKKWKYKNIKYKFDIDDIYYDDFCREKVGTVRVIARTIKQLPQKLSYMLKFIPLIKNI